MFDTSVSWDVIVDLATARPALSRRIGDGGAISFRSPAAGRDNERLILVTFEPLGAARYRVVFPPSATPGICDQFASIVSGDLPSRRGRLVKWLQDWAAIETKRIEAEKGRRRVRRKRHRSTSIRAASGGLPSLGKRR